MTQNDKYNLNLRHFMQRLKTYKHADCWLFGTLCAIHILLPRKHHILDFGLQPWTRIEELWWRWRWSRSTRFILGTIEAAYAKLLLFNYEAVSWFCLLICLAVFSTLLLVTLFMIKVGYPVAILYRCAFCSRHAKKWNLVMESYLILILRRREPGNTKLHLWLNKVFTLLFIP